MFICTLSSCRLGTSRRLMSGMINLQILGNLFRESIARHVVANVDRGGEAFGIGAAMALDDNAVKAEADAAIHLAGVHLLAQQVEGPLGAQIAALRENRSGTIGRAS